MNDQAIIANFRAAVETLQSIESWQAWRIVSGIGYPIAFDTAPDTVGEVVMRAMGAACFNPGDTLAVQHSHAGRNARTLWLFTVKKSTKNGTWRESTNGGRRVFVGRMEPKLVTQLALTAPFAPAEPFDAFRDGASGRDLQLVEAP